ncbi:MAG TPA: hypothetical protein VJZ49_05995 [Syntrophales bacterium]|nr:hypothetical protein [Syntrophales bacterium]
MAGAIYLASRKSVLGLLKVIVINSIFFGIGLIIFSLSRVFWLSLCNTAFGMIPFGSLLAGSLAHAIGAPETIMIGGISCVLGSVLFAIKLSSLRGLIHPIYVKKGIILEEQA